MAESGADEVAVIRVPGPATTPGEEWTVVGRIPTADLPESVVVVGGGPGGNTAQLVWVSAEAVGGSPNPTGPDPILATDPIFWAFTPVAPKTDIFREGVTYIADYVTGRAGFLPSPPMIESRR